MTITPKSFRKAVYLSLALSLLAVAGISLMILGLRHTIGLTVQTAVAYLAMIGIIELVGVRFRSSLVQGLAGIWFALLVLMTGTIAGATTTMLLMGQMDVSSYVLKPLFWVGFYGFLPAMIIGLRGSALIRKFSQREQGAPLRKRS